MKKTVAIIPARYASTRFPGKPLADIEGKPMIRRVWEQAKKVEEFAETYIATDDERIEKVCRDLGMEVLMTSPDHENHIYRIHETTRLVEADYFVCINGDEPLIQADVIGKILDPIRQGREFWAINLVTTVRDATQVVDFSKIKMAVGRNDRIVYMSRSPVPYPRGSSMFEYKKYVGVECMSREALDFYVETPMGELERIEDIDHLRFLENGKPMIAVYVESDNLSVDTPKDLEKVRDILRRAKM